MVAVVKIRRLICVYCNYTSDLENTLSSLIARRHVEAEAELVANHKKDLRLKVPRQIFLGEAKHGEGLWLVAALLWRRRCRSCTYHIDVSRTDFDGQSYWERASKVIEFKGQLSWYLKATLLFRMWLCNASFLFIGLVADGAYGQVPTGYAGLVLDLLDMCLLCGFGIQDMLRLQVHVSGYIGMKVLKYQKNAGFVYKVNGDPVTRYKSNKVNKEILAGGIYHVKKIDEERLNEDACITIGDHRLSRNVDKSTDISKIQSKMGKLRHENQKSTKRSQRFKAEARKVKSSQTLVNQ
ncbi:hypothetical protein Tco_0010856 [Tanacetum coccineum]